MPGASKIATGWQLAGQYAKLAFAMLKPRSARERAARALCRKDGYPENILFEGRPVWQSYLDVVDAVIAALDEDRGSPAT